MEAKVIDLNSYRLRKQDRVSPELADRCERIKASIERINQLMTELRSMSNNTSKDEGEEV